VGHVAQSGALGLRNVHALFLILGWDRYGFHKKRAWTSYAELVFLHLVGSVSYIVDFGASGPQNVDAQFFMLGLDSCGFQKKRIRRLYAKHVF
jgi:hypothetical protein